MGQQGSYNKSMHVYASDGTLGDRTEYDSCIQGLLPMTMALRSKLLVVLMQQCPARLPRHHPGMEWLSGTNRVRRK